MLMKQEYSSLQALYQIHFEKDLNKFKDQEIEFVITEFDPRKRRIIGNRKTLLVAEES